MFKFSRDGQDLTIHITGEHAEAMGEMAEVLELNESWPIVPLALENLYRMCRVHHDTKEKLREILMLDPDETQGMFLFDMENVKIAGKKMELGGLNDKGEH